MTQSFFQCEAQANEYGYRDLKTFADGSQAAIWDGLAFTCAIVYEFSYSGYEDRWCYHSYVDAKRALDEWDGKGEPKGWHRHPATGRRVNEKGEMYVAY